MLVTDPYSFLIKYVQQQKSCIIEDRWTNEFDSNDRLKWASFDLILNRSSSLHRSSSVFWIHLKQMQQPKLQHEAEEKQCNEYLRRDHECLAKQKKQTEKKNDSGD